MTCANCPSDACYLVNDDGALPVAYCSVCLPEYLRDRANLGDLVILPEAEPVVVPDPLADLPPRAPARRG